jgi:hypothetical protein
MKKPYDRVYQFKVTLKDITPRIWRRVQVPETYTFWDLNVAIWDLMKWGGHHLHQFTILNPKTGIKDCIGIPDPLLKRDILTGWEHDIAAYFSMENRRAEYLYDFGDEWDHAILLEKILPRESGKEYPCCIAGKRNSPPDDVGSVSGYEEFCAIMKDPRHPQHKAKVKWYDGEYDPEAFDCNNVLFFDPADLLELLL